MGRSRYKIVDPILPHFVTCTVLHWIPVFTRPETVAIVLDSLRFLMKENLKVYAYVILENHLHLMLQSNDLNRDIARFKSYTSKRLLAYLIKRGYVDLPEHWCYSSAKDYSGSEGLLEVVKDW